MSVIRLGSGSPWEGIVGYSRVVVRGDAAWVSGTTSLVDGVAAHPGDAGAQTRQALTIIREVLERAGFTLADVVRTRMFVTDISRWEEIGRVHGEFFGDVRPASSMVQVAGLTAVGVEGAIVGKALYAGAFTLPEALRVTEEVS